MENKKRYQLLPYGIATAMVLVSLLSLGIALPSFYELNDDLMIQSILSGAFSGSPDAHAVYMNFPLTGLLALLYSIAPGVSWYGILLQGCFAVSLFFIVATLLSMVKKPENYIFTIVPVWLMFWAVCLGSYVVQQYTIAAVVLGSTGLLLFGVRNTEDTVGGTLRKNAVSIVMLVVTYLLRSKSFLLLLPFALVVVLWKCTEEQFSKKALKKYGAVVGVTLLFVLLCFLSNRIFYMGEWSSFLKVNDARTEVYDFTGVLPFNDTTKDFYTSQGLHEEEVAMLEEYNISWVSQANADVLNSMASEAKVMNDLHESVWTRVKHLCRDYYFEMRYSERFALMSVATIITYVLLLGVMVAKKQWKYLAFIPIMVVLRSVVWMALLYTKRFPDRVEISLYIAELFVLAALLYSMLYKNDGKQKWMTVGVAFIFTGVLFLLAVNQGITLKKDLVYRGELSADTAVAEDYFADHEEKIYCVDVYSFVFQDAPVHIRGNENEFENYLLMGGWLYGSPLEQQKYAKLGTDNPVTELPKNNAWYYVILESRSEQTLIDYYAFQNTPITMQEEDRITLPSGRVLRIMTVTYQKEVE